jgi:hypothetical protein
LDSAFFDSAMQTSWPSVSLGRRGLRLFVDLETL